MKRVRLAVLGGFVAVIAGLIVVGAWYVHAPLDGDTVEDHQYRIVDLGEPETGPVISVRKFFSYACVHCYKMSRLLPGWQANLHEDVEFSLVPLQGNPMWTVLARGYYGLQRLGLLESQHARIYEAIHDQRVNLQSLATLSRWIDGKGTTAERFLRAVNAPDVEEQLREARDLARKYRISSVPTFLVAGKYVVDPGKIGRRQTLLVIDQLIAMERQARGLQSRSLQ